MDWVKDHAKPWDIEWVIDKIKKEDIVKSSKKINYYNIPCAFDIETTSFYSGVNKQAIMYEWTLSLNGYIIIGRYWSEFEDVIEKLEDNLGLSLQNRLIIYVHNLSFEFQFMRKHFQWDKVFSLSQRKPIQAVTIGGIEFRCSYLLSGYSLERLGKQLTRYKVEKMKGDLDYELKRHNKTPLNEKELRYCINDVLVVTAYIQEKIENDGNITKIPLTKTGYVRNYCREMCLYGDRSNKIESSKKFNNYRNIMKGLMLNVETYEQLQDAFAGGFTHANPFYSNMTVYNVDSYDFTSSYPYVIVSEKFPMSKPEYIDITSEDMFYENLEEYCCLFDIEITNLKPRHLFENYISKSHCHQLVNPVENNGRIVSAEHLVTTVTEQDFYLIQEFYCWDNLSVYNFKRFRKGFLPKDLVLSVLKLYKDKTELKDVEDKVVEYLNSKEQVNAMYGMMVTDICRDEILYGTEWGKETPDLEVSIAKYNHSVKRFLYYAWGIWVTAYARMNLFTGILECKEDYVYSDTDSIKIINSYKHEDYFNDYNDVVIQKLEYAMTIQGIDIEMTRPKNIYGEVKQIGIWEKETEKHIYTRFKTLGAKRYLVEQNNKLKLTVSGVNKEMAIKYLLNKYKTNENVFEHFSDELLIPADYTGKNTHTYLDDEQVGVIVDYLGNKLTYHELSSTHLEKVEYSLSLSDIYIDYLFEIQETLK